MYNKMQRIFDTYLKKFSTIMFEKSNIIYFNYSGFFQNGYPIYILTYRIISNGIQKYRTDKYYVCHDEMPGQESMLNVHFNMLTRRKVLGTSSQLTVYWNSKRVSTSDSP